MPSIAFVVGAATFLWFMVFFMELGCQEPVKDAAWLATKVVGTVGLSLLIAFLTAFIAKSLLNG
jgi:fructose-specific phosphotransferase system IIC component